MKKIVKNYEISDNKILKDIKICLVTDFHLSHISNDKKFKLVLESIKKTKPDYICIVGDYIDSINVLEEKELYNKSINYLKQLASISNVIYTLGNHEVTKILGNKKREYYLNDKWISDINKIDNLIYLNNNIYEDGNIRFIGYVPPFKYYDKHNEDKNLLISDYNSKIKIKNDKYNILLFHSPIHILNDSVISNINLILSGHMHNGLTPNFLDKIWKSNTGLVGPHNTFFPKTARGIKNKIINTKEVYMVISGGVTKVHEVSSKIFHFLDKFYMPEVDYITLRKG